MVKLQLTPSFLVLYQSNVHRGGNHVPDLASVEGKFLAVLLGPGDQLVVVFNELLAFELFQERLEDGELLFRVKLVVLDGDIYRVSVVMNTWDNRERIPGTGRTNAALDGDVERLHAIGCQDEDTIVVFEYA